MRVRTNVILPEDLLAKIDIIAGEKQRRSIIIETALREYVAREEAKAPLSLETETVDKKVGARSK